MTTFSTNNALPTRTTAAVRTGATDALARLMSTENITVVRDPASPTATFNTKTRVLTLPVYKTEMSKAMADGLVGHEVGHALFTPSDEATIRGAMNDIDPNNPAVVHDYLNVIEDARIERMMKTKFPGLRRTFVEMYGEMQDKDFFQVNGQNLADLPLVDRINLHYKAGINGHMIVPFSSEEEAFIKMIDAAKTFDDVVNAARELYDYVTQPKREDQPQPQNGGNGQGFGKGNDQGADGQGSGDDQQDGDQGAGDAGGDQTAAPTMQDKNGNETMDQTGDQSDSSNNAQQGNNGSSASLGHGKQNAPASKTNSAMSNNIAQQRDQNAKKQAFYRLPTINLDKVIVDYKRIHKDITDCRAQVAVHNTGAKFDSAKQMTKFIDNSRDYVQTLVREFERKMAADEQRRTFVSRTGSLDMSRVHTYRFNDDLFLKSSWVADGKNHGMVMFIDWSGSMSRTLENTMYQMFNLILFCNALRIPFEVYAFSTCALNFQVESIGSHTDYYAEVTKRSATVCKEYTVDVTEKQERNGTKYTQTTINTNGCAHVTPFSLLNLCSSRMSKKEMRSALENLMFLARCTGFAPGYLQLGGTPLDECVIAAIPVVNEFRKASKAQIVNTILLTDGASGSYPFNAHQNGERIVVRAASGHTYTAEPNQDSTSFLRNIFRAETKSSLTGFYLVEPAYASGAFYDYFPSNSARKDALTSFTDNKYAVVTDTKRFGYDNYFLLDSTTKSLSNKDVVGGNAEQSFMQTAALKKSTRAVLSKFTDTIAKDFKF